jgi:hypothetical protein
MRGWQLQAADLHRARWKAELRARHGLGTSSLMALNCQRATPAPWGTGGASRRRLIWTPAARVATATSNGTSVTRRSLVPASYRDTRDVSRDGDTDPHISDRRCEPSSGGMGHVASETAECRAAPRDGPEARARLLGHGAGKPVKRRVPDVASAPTGSCVVNATPPRKTSCQDLAVGRQEEGREHGGPAGVE